VALGDAQKLRDVFTWPFVEHAQGDHGPLNFAKLGDAGAQADRFLGARNEIVLSREVMILLVVHVDGIMWTSVKVSPPVVTGGIADNRRENGAKVDGGFELTGLNQIEQRAKPFLDTVDGVLRRQPLVSCECRQRAALRLGDMGQSIEHVLMGLWWHGRSPTEKGGGPPQDYTGRAVMRVTFKTFS